MSALLWWLAAGLLLVLVGAYPPLAGHLAHLLVLAVVLLVTGALRLLAQPLFLALVLAAVAVVRWRRPRVRRIR